MLLPITRVRKNRIRAVGALGVAALSVVALAACSTSDTPGGASGPSSSSSASASSTAIPLLDKDAVIAAEVPAAYQGRPLIWGSSTQAPYTNQAADGSVNGLAVDLAAQLGSILGVKIQLQVTPLASVIPEIQSSRLDIGGPAGDYVERQSAVDFSDFAQSNATMLVQKSGTFQPATLLDICGAKVGVQQGAATNNTIAAVNQECQDKGKSPATVMTYADDASALLALKSGRIDTRLDPIAPNSLSAATSNGQLKLINIDAMAALPGASATYGIQTKKDSGLDKPITDALKLLNKKGVYARLFDKWQIAASALPADRIKSNGSTLHQAS